MLDLTKEWFAVVRTLRQHQQESSATAGHQPGLDGGGGYSSAAEALVRSRWRTPLTPFMQQVGGGVDLLGVLIVGCTAGARTHIFPELLYSTAVLSSVL